MRRVSILVVLAGCTIQTGEEPPPPPTWGAPISGGTMIVTRDGNRAVIADPDRDRVVIVDLVSEKVVDTITLAAHSEPGRVIEDDAGRIHVALRGSGELLTITGTDRLLRPICGEPRGLAYQATTDLVHVACATGELVSLPPGGGEPVRVVRVERDLRDVLVRDTGIAVTTFRSATMLELDSDGAIAKRVQPPTTQRSDMSMPTPVPATPSVAWRTITLPGGEIMMAHQRRLGTTLRVITGGYGGQCGSPVESTITTIGSDDRPVATAPIADGALIVDVAVNPMNGALALASAGSEAVMIVPRSSMGPDMGGCSHTTTTPLISPEIGAPTAVAYRPNGALLVFYPESDGITILDDRAPRGISLGDRPRIDAGRSMFHRATLSGLACASCHPEARDDGGVWTFDALGQRRTQNLGGSILSRAPYHWGGDMPTLHVLVDDVFTQRMSGDEVSDEQGRALGAWLDRVPAPRGVVTDVDAAARGGRCSTRPARLPRCHQGALYTNNKLEM